MCDKIQLQNLYERARNKYKPSIIKTIIIAEAPPNAFERFFYYEDVKDKDYLFLNIIEILYPDWKTKYMNSKRSSTIKECILKKFQADGYYLLDLYETFVDLKERKDIETLHKLSNKLSQLIDEKVPVILIKANVYDTAFKTLKVKFNVINERLPFPSSGQQSNIKRAFKKLIALIAD